MTLWFIETICIIGTPTPFNGLNLDVLIRLVVTFATVCDIKTAGCKSNFRKEAKTFAINARPPQLLTLPRLTSDSRGAFRLG